MRKIERRGGARPGAGAKPKPLAELRRNRVVLHLTDAEHRELRRAAGRTQLGTFIREATFETLARRGRRS